MKIAVFILICFCTVLAQEVRIPNVSRIAKAWNGIVPEAEQSNQSLAKLDLLLHARFQPKVVELNAERRQKLEDERRKACVGYYKSAKESMIKQLEALNTLIEEEDY
jgi:hypothetical protein